MPRPLTRSEFLKILAAGTAGVTFLRGADEALAGITGTDPALDAAALSGDLAAAQAAYPDVAVAHGTAIAAITKKAVAAIGGMGRFVDRGDDVVIKPNICVSYRAPKYAATTNPTVVATLVRLAFGAGASRVRVMDNPFSGSARDAYRTSGIGAAVRKAGGTMHVMTSSGYVKASIPNGVNIKSWSLYKAMLNCDVLINVPIAKQHSATGLTLAGKNMMGATNRQREMHARLSQRIADINSRLKPDLTVIDAVRILIRNGPTGGSLSDVRRKNIVVASKDWVAADAWVARKLFDKAPSKVTYLPPAARMGLGVMDLSKVTVRRYEV